MEWTCGDSGFMGIIGFCDGSGERYGWTVLSKTIEGNRSTNAQIEELPG